MIRLGLIGCGEHAEGGHAVPLARYKASHPDEIELTAVCDLQLEKARAFCSKYGFLNAYSDSEEMFARHELDGCVAVVPVEKISTVGISLLEKKIPCVVEKPLSASGEELRQLIDASQSTGTPHMVSVNRRFMPLLNRAINWSHSVGTLRYVRSILTRHARSEHDFLWTTAVHAVDALRHIAGEVSQANIRAINGTRRTDWYAIDVQFANGVLGRIDVLPTAGVREETYELLGDNFRAIVTCPFGPRRGWCSFRDDRLVIEEPASGPEDVVNGCYDEASEFIRAVSNKRRPHPSIEDVSQSVQLCLEMAKSVELTKNLAPAKS